MDEVQQAAEEAYDRTASAGFTSFVAYENASTPLLNNWHRNVIFRNDRVVRKPVNAIDMAVVVNNDPTKESDRHPGRRSCPTSRGCGRCRRAPRSTIRCRSPSGTSSRRTARRAGTSPPGKARRCDFITIPHNSNLGGGIVADGKTIFPPMFLDPYNMEDAKRHLQMEPLVEIYQDKGASECRYDPRFLAGTNTIDEFCAFEILDSKSLGSASGVGSGRAAAARSAPDTWGERAYVRNVWKDGIQYAAKKTWDGINPFKMGVVSASDSHTGVMGWHPETDQWPGHLGIDDAYPMADSSTIQNGTGGPSVVWAEENTRDSIFEALRRKETYGTSGPRMKVRFFGGWDYPPTPAARTSSTSATRAACRWAATCLPAPPRTAPHLHHRRHLGRQHQDQAAADPDRQGLGRRDGQDARAGLHAWPATRQPAQPAVGDRLQDLQGQAGARQRALCTVWKDPDFDPERARVLLRARAREAGLPLQHAVVPQVDRGRPARHRHVQHPARGAPERQPRNDKVKASQRRQVLLEPDHRHLRAAGDPGARLDLADLVRAGGRSAR